MINKKRPNVIMVTGNVKITRIGLTIKFNKLMTTATINAVVYVSTPTPGKTFDSTTTARALNRIRSMNFIISGLNKKGTGMFQYL